MFNDFPTFDLFYSLANHPAHGVAYLLVPLHSFNRMRCIDLSHLFLVYFKHNNPCG